MKKLFTLALIASFLFNLNVSASESKYPKSAADQRNERVGSILNNKDGSSGFNLFGGGSKNSSDGYKGIGVNTYLWKASLEVINFMPIAISDSSGGVITTEWSEDLDHPGERYKVNILIKSTDLNVQSLKVTVFKQVLKDNIWRDVRPSSQVAEDLEDKIFTKARALKLAQEH